jgi:hypothetical protein
MVICPSVTSVEFVRCEGNNAIKQKREGAVKTSDIYGYEEIQKILAMSLPEGYATSYRF